MIRNFRHKGLKRLYHWDDASGVGADLRLRATDILKVLDVASEPQALNLPTFHLHPLKGDLAGFWAVTVRANWRIIFRFEDGDACDVQLVDYH